MIKKELQRVTEDPKAVLPICSWCVRPRINGEYVSTEDIEAAGARKAYHHVIHVLKRASHGICPECTEKYHSEFLGDPIPVPRSS